MSAKITGTEATIAVGEDAQGALSAPAASTPERHVFAGRYEVRGLVGAGGMGTVYRARDAELDEIVALKLLRRDVLDQPGMLDRFRQEVKLARRVTHRNVARTYDIGEHAGEKFLTMEFVDGEALSARVAREGALPLDVVVAIAGDICAGLQAAHTAGIIHRDLKPDNVLLARDGRVAITDFGIARAFADAGAAPTMGLALGTPAYMAPEQVEGARDLDARTDVYALGAMLFECLTGERAWSGDSVWAVAAARLTQPPPDPRIHRPDLPDGAAKLVMKCMARKREDRFASAVQVAGALATLTLPTGPARPSAPPPPALPHDVDAKALCVLPFRNVGDAANAYVAEGLSDDLIDALSMTAGLRVLARGAVARFRDVERDAREIGRELGVHVVVEGSVRRVSGMLRVSARVVSVADGFQLWAKRFDRPEKDVLSVSDEVANAIAEALTVRRSGPARAVPSDARAVDLYLRARHAFHRGWRDDIGESIALFEQALALAPDDPTILAGYARAQMRRFMFDTEGSAGVDAERKGSQAAERALALAPHLGEARAALANMKWVMGDHVGCARELREALRVAPSSADVNELYGRMLLEVGEPARAVSCLSALSALVPGVDLTSGDLLRGRAYVGDWAPFEAAVEQGRPAGPPQNVSYFLLARLAMWRRDTVAAAVLYKRVEAEAFSLHDEVLRMLSMAQSGRMPSGMDSDLDAWGRVVGRARRRPMFFRQLATELHAFLGNEDSALRTLAQADALGLIDVTWTDRCPLFDSVRARPAFVAARDRIAARAKETLDVLEGRVP